jgi:hypothetical protein
VAAHLDGPVPLLGAVREGALHLHLGEELGHALHDLGAVEEAVAQVHQLGHAAAVADELQELGGDERHGLRVVEPEASCEALLREEAGLVQEQLVDVVGGEVHTPQVGAPRQALPG